MATGLRIKREGLKLSSARLLPVALVTALITLLPSLLIPGILPAGHAVDSTVYFNGNNGNSGSMPAQVAGAPTPLSLNQFSRDGYVFSGWCTVVVSPGANCTGAAYAEGASYPFVTTETLFARWTEISFLYNPSTGSAIALNPRTYSQSLAGIKGGGASTLTGYTIGGWCTNPLSPGATCASVSGTSYGLGASPPTSSTTATFNLYAIWIPNLTVTYDSQGGTAVVNGSTPIGGSITTSAGPPSWGGYAFNGWFTAGTGGSAITFPYTHGQTANFTLYAQWTGNALTVTYNSQGGSPISNGSTVSGGSIASSPGTPTRIGYTFKGWFAASTGGSAITFPYAHGKVSGFTLHAQWAQNLTITYDSRGGSAISDGLTTTGGSIASSPGTPTKINSTFLGWFAASTGGSAITFPYTHSKSANFILYAQWSENSITWDANISSEPGEDYDPTIYNGALTYASGSAIGIPGELGVLPDNPTRDFYDFAGWWTSASGGTQITETYAPASPYGPVTFFGRWTAHSRLLGLGIASGSLNEDFSGEVTSYTASVANSVQSITVTPTRNQDSANITVNGTSVTSGSASSAISLSVGSNTITVVVTAPNASTSSYTIVVTRAAGALAPSINAPSVSGNIYKGVVTTISATSNVVGVIRFFLGGKRISTCKDRIASGSGQTYSATCSWKPPVTGRQLLTATLIPASSPSSPVTSSVTTSWVLRRTTTR